MSEAMKLLLREDGGERRAALMLGGRLCEYYSETGDAQSLVDAIFLGTVERVLPDVNAAFVKLGLEHNGFLPMSETESFIRRQGRCPLVSGRDVIVQVKKDAKGDKGAFLGRDITLAGQYAVLMPLSGFTGASKRITDGDEREAALALGKRLSDGRFGVIVRHAALSASDAEVAAELQTLWERWQSVSEAAEHRKAPALLLRDADIASALMRDYAARYDIEVYAAAPRREDAPQSVIWNELTQIELQAAWQGARVDAEVSAALQRKVPLSGGGSLVIDEREALQTIDLNSGTNVTAPEGMSLALFQNLAAVGEIARQIRLRALSGIIIVDFIDMQTDDERERVIEAMREAVKDDRVKTVVHGFTELGLLELTRKRTRESLSEALGETCAACGGSGRAKKKGKQK